MKTLIALLLLGTNLAAQDSQWKIVGSEVLVGKNGKATNFSIRNTSKQAISLLENWWGGGGVSVNLTFAPPGKAVLSQEVIRTLKGTPAFVVFAEPCHAPRNFVVVKPGEVVSVTIPNSGFGGMAMSLVLTEKDRTIVLGVFVEPQPTVAEQGGARQPATAPKSGPKCKEKPKPESKRRSP